MTNINWFKRKAYSREINKILATDYQIVKGRVPKEGIAPVNEFCQQLAELWKSNGGRPIDKLVWDKAMSIVKAEFPDAITPDFKDTLAYEILNKGR